MKAVLRLTLVFGTFFRGNSFPSLAHSGRASCQLLRTEWACNTGNCHWEACPA